MSVRNATILLLALSTLLFLAACGSSGSSPATPVAPPSGNFSNSNLNGTYVFSVSGTDNTNSNAYTITGTFTANGSGGTGKGGITGGTIDINDPSEFSTPAVGVSISSSSTFSVGVDGRGQAVIGTNIGNGFPPLTFDFVLSSSSHGLITEFDTFGSASGTLDLQASGVTPSGSYAYSFSGANSSGTAAFASVGNFTLGSGGAITAGLADFNSGALTISQNQPLTGTVAVSSPPSTVLSTSQYPTLDFDVFPIDATHLKFIEVDTNGTLSGDAFSQTSTAMPVGTMAFTLAGITSGNAPVAAGGFMATDSSGDITNTSTEDYNVGGTLSPSTPVPFSGSYAAGGAGRYTLTNFSGFTPAGVTFAAYPSSGGLLLLEIDLLGVTTGAAYTQTAGATLAVSQGYGMNLTGDNLSNSVEVDDIAEFTTATGGTLSSGIIDENSAPGGGPTLGLALSSGTYGALDSQGRYGISATAGNSTTTTLLGGFDIIAYTVDGTTFPFMEYDAGQVATGVVVLQNPSSSSPALAHPQTVMVRSLVHPHIAHPKKN
ncbi:MAG: hypothetical protein WB523_16820 [Candidatus Sulfotelmatobacter sp.]